MKYIVLTPEEWVRLHFVQYLMNEVGYSKTYLAIERELNLNGLKKRTDVVVYDSMIRPKLIVECKRASFKLNQETFEQIARYNMKLRVNYFAITNGLQHLYYKINYSSQKIEQIEQLPAYENL